MKGSSRRSFDFTWLPIIARVCVRFLVCDFLGWPLIDRIAVGVLDFAGLLEEVALDLDLILAFGLSLLIFCLRPRAGFFTVRTFRAAMVFLADFFAARGFLDLLIRSIVGSRLSLSSGQK